MLQIIARAVKFDKNSDKRQSIFLSNIFPPSVNSISREIFISKTPDTSLYPLPRTGIKYTADKNIEEEQIPSEENNADFEDENKKLTEENIIQPCEDFDNSEEHNEDNINENSNAKHMNPFRSNTEFPPKMSQILSAQKSPLLLNKTRIRFPGCGTCASRGLKDFKKVSSVKVKFL
jgi:hypothetical protein